MMTESAKRRWSRKNQATWRAKLRPDQRLDCVLPIEAADALAEIQARDGSTRTGGVVKAVLEKNARDRK